MTDFAKAVGYYNGIPIIELEGDLRPDSVIQAENADIMERHAKAREGFYADVEDIKERLALICSRSSIEDSEVISRAMDALEAVFYD